jgi:hypothetical protein
MSGLIERFLEKAGGPWIRADNVKPGDTVTIRNVSLDEESFDRPYIVIDGTLDRTGEQVKVRLSQQNVNRIIQDLGRKEAGWIGHKLQVLSIENYPGLGRRGVLWKGLRAEGFGKVLEPQLRSFLKAHLDTLGPKIPGPVERVEPEVVAEAERLGLIKTFEHEGMRWYLLTESGRKMAETG